MKTYLYKFSDGHEFERPATRLTMDEVEIYCREKNAKLVYNGFHDHMGSIQLLNANSHSTGDGFKPGWQENIGMYCGDRRQYNQALKEQGLVEIGNEKFNGTSKKVHSCANEGFVKALIEEGDTVSGEEAEAIISGEFFKDDSIA